MNVIEKHEPLMYKAINNVFKESYEYTAKYKQFILEHKVDEKLKKKGIKRLF